MTFYTAFVHGTGRLLVLSISILALVWSAGVSSVSAEPILMGLYPPGPLEQPGVVETMVAVDSWLGGKRMAIAGSFITIEDNPSYLPSALEAAWSHGYVPFVNIKSSNTSTAIATGLVDGPIRNWAVQFALWAKTGGRRAFLAPLQEMNYGGNPYYIGGPVQVKLAYRRIRQIINEELANQGILGPNTHAAVLWVFSGNGYPPPPAADVFENYYPGGDVVDVVGTSGYNFGGCPTQVEARVWQPFEVMLKPYLDRLHVMAPDKLIFISETGSVDKQANGIGNKNVWLADTYTQATLIPNLRAILYLNTAEIRSSLNQCPQGADYRLFNPDTGDWTGFKNTVNALSNYVYWAPGSSEMRQLFGDPTTPTPSIFAAVLPLSRSVTVPGPPATAFAVMINAGTAAATNCRPAPPVSPPANLGVFGYQTTDVTNALIGAPNTPADIAAGAFQNYVFGVTPTGPIPLTSLAMRFMCDNAPDAPQTPGVNNFYIVADTTPLPDTIALMATVSNDGVVRIAGPTSTQLFAIGTSNVGATGIIDVSGDTGTMSLPVTLTVCETTGGPTCLAPPTPTVTVNYVGGTNRSFAFFAQASGSIAFDPGINRVFARLKQSGLLLGATSAAVCTKPNAGC